MEGGEWRSITNHIIRDGDGGVHCKVSVLISFFSLVRLILFTPSPFKKREFYALKN